LTIPSPPFYYILDIRSWNVSAVETFKGMFYNAYKFNQNISGWDLSRAIDTSAMFQGAGTFDQNLCAWGASLTAQTPNENTNRTKSRFLQQRDVIVDVMFGSSGCELQDNPALNGSIPGPFCASCTSSSTRLYGIIHHETLVAESIITILASTFVTYLLFASTQ
jgi:Mycoplasma protein of unknown function, DUF285